jgi:hypothetical protein
VASGALAGVVIVGFAVFLTRDRIAARFARQWLRDHGVASAVVVNGFSAHTLRGQVRLGDPADPDLTVDRLEVDYTLGGPWSGEAIGLRTRKVRLIRPRLKGHLVDGRLRLGSLDVLIKVLLSAPPTGEPPPDITVVDGQVLLATSGGVARLRGAGEMRAGRLVNLDARLDPFDQTIDGRTWRGAGGGVHAVGLGRRLIASLDLGPTAVSVGDGEMSLARGAVSANLPYPLDRERWGGPARLMISATALSGRAGQARMKGGEIAAGFEGVLEGDARSQTLSGPLHVSGHLASIRTPWGAVKAAGATVAFTRLTVTRGAGGVSAAGDGGVTLFATRLEGEAGALSGFTGTATFRDLKVQAGRRDAPRFTADLDGRMAGRGGLGPAFAGRLARAAPGFAKDAPYAVALRSALEDFRFAAPAVHAEFRDRAIALALGASLRVDAAGGARLTLGARAVASAGPRPELRGGADLAMGGGGLPTLTLALRHADIIAGRAQADVVGEGAFDVGIARDVHVRAGGHVRLDGTRARFDLAACAPVALRRLDLVPNALTDLAARVCPGAGPLIDASPAGWRVDGRLEDVAGAMPVLSLDLRRAAGTVEAAGGWRGPDTASLAFDRAHVTDTADDIRFRPLDGVGRLDLAGGVWTGNVALASQSGHPIGHVRLRHAPATGEGRVDIDAGSLVFRTDGFQPGDLTPKIRFARDAHGEAGFVGWFAWSRVGLTGSGGTAYARDLGFRSPIGQVEAVDAAIRLGSLVPLDTAPLQVVTAARIDGVTPLTDVKAVFTLRNGRVTLRGVDAAFAQGHVSLEPGIAVLADIGAFRSALVLDRVALGQIIAASNLADVVQTDAVIDGRIPFGFRGARVEFRQGRIAAVRPGRISFSRAALTSLSAQATTGSASAASPTSAEASFAQDIAYQALDNLAFDHLDASVNSQARDRLGVLFHIKGRHDPPVRRRAMIAWRDLLGGHLLARPIALPSDTRIDLTLDSSLNFGQLVRALGAAWRDALARGDAGRRSGVIQDTSSMPAAIQRPQPP